MNIRDFEYIIAVDELKSFTKAAKKCFVSQPALSFQIDKIEDQLGFEIFERNSRHVITTKKGDEFVKYAKSIIDLVTKTKAIKNSETVLRIALIPTICPYLLPLIIKDLDEQFPKTKFYFLEQKTENLMKALENGEIDIGIIAYFEHLIDDNINYTKLYDEEFLLALPKKSKLDAKDFPKILSEKQLILLEEGNCISDNVKDICSLYKNNSKKGSSGDFYSDFYATNIETVKNMIKINNGAALLPKLSCLNEKDLKIKSLKPKKSREIGLVFRKSYKKTNIINRIREVIAKNIQKIN